MKPGRGSEGQPGCRATRLGGLAACVVLVAFASTAASARQIGDKPPLLNGSEKASQVLVATGLDSASAAAVFVCTSMERTGGKDITLGVEWWSGTSFENDVTLGEGVVVMTPGDTRILATHDTAHFQGETLIPNASGATRGSARILATSKRIVCTAYSADKDNDPPTFLTDVPLYVKGRQK
jgi:hypothetical protein